MGKFLITFSLAGLMLACTPSPNQENDENMEEADSLNNAKEGDTYGAVISTENARDLDWLALTIQPGDSLMVTVAGEITGTCPMKGCWMKLDGPGEDVRVTFKDYGFFVPKEGVEGKEAVVEGYAVKHLIDVATLKHYAEDAGKPAEEIAMITEPKEEVAIIANGVVIR